MLQRQPMLQREPKLEKRAKYYYYYYYYTDICTECAKLMKNIRWRTQYTTEVSQFKTSKYSVVF